MDENDKVNAALDMFDGVDFPEMRREVWRVFSEIEYKINPKKYPNLARLAEKQASDVPDMHLKDVAEFFGIENKIKLIKEIRRRMPIGLYEAKMMADGIFASKGWMK